MVVRNKLDKLPGTMFGYNNLLILRLSCKTPQHIFILEFEMENFPTITS